MNYVFALLVCHQHCRLCSRRIRRNRRRAEIGATVSCLCLAERGLSCRVCGGLCRLRLLCLERLSWAHDWLLPMRVETTDVSMIWRSSHPCTWNYGCFILPVSWCTMSSMMVFIFYIYLIFIYMLWNCPIVLNST